MFLKYKNKKMEIIILLFLITRVMIYLYPIFYSTHTQDQ